jgi:hypothetical protein
MRDRALGLERQANATLDQLRWVLAWPWHDGRLSSPADESTKRSLRQTRPGSSRQIGVLEAISNLKGARPTGIRPDEIEAMLQAIPDMRPTLQSADATELAEICDAFRITVTYDKPNRTIELSATIVPELLPKDMNPTYTEGPVGVFVYSGGGIRTRDLRVMRSGWAPSRDPGSWNI